MSRLVLSDIHSNAPALEAVLADAAGHWESVLLLGDVVGYGPHPNEVCALLRELPGLAAVRGNHDKAAVGLGEPEFFHEAARTAIEWTGSVLREEHADWLRELPRGPLELEEGRLVLSHGTPFDEEAYLLGGAVAREVATAWPGAIVLYGHTHLPTALRLGESTASGHRPAAGERLELGEGTWLLNPGSVGQPRDGSTEASYALLDPEARSFELRRVAYPVREVQAAMEGAGLPGSLVRRLAEGA